MRLVICDGNRILGEALAAALETGDHEMTAVATGTADDCFAAVARCRPNVCMLDPHLPDVDHGMQVIREIRNHYPDTAVVMFSDLTEPSTLAQATKLGIAGFLSKNRSVNQVADALHRIIDGKSAFDSMPLRESSRPTAPSTLTPREAEVLRRIAAGQHTRQMACEMNIAISTLRTYVKNLFIKLEVHSRLEAAAVASRSNLLGAIPAQPVPQRDEETALHSA